MHVTRLRFAAIEDDDERFIRTFARDICGRIIPRAELHRWSLDVQEHQVLIRHDDEAVVRIIPAIPHHGWSCTLGMLPIQDRKISNPRAQELISRLVARRKLKTLSRKGA